MAFLCIMLGLMWSRFKAIHVFAAPVLILILSGFMGIKHTTAEARAMITDIQYKMDINTLHRMEEDKAIQMNDIARVKLDQPKPFFADDYTVNRVTGSIILVDEATNETVAAGMVR